MNFFLGIRTCAKLGRRFRLGGILLNAMQTRDMPLLESAVLVTAAIRIGANLVADVTYARLNPRIRF